MCRHSVPAHGGDPILGGDTSERSEREPRINLGMTPLATPESSLKGDPTIRKDRYRKK